MRNAQPILLSALAYLLVTFPLAIAWHLFLFKAPYEEIGYIGRDEPIFLFGFLSIAIQGFIMAWAYPKFVGDSFSIRSGIRYALVVGAFFWTSHVLAFAAKGDVQHLDLFIPLETVYLLLQFGIFGLALGMLFSCLGKPTISSRDLTKEVVAPEADA